MTLVTSSPTPPIILAPPIRVLTLWYLRMEVPWQWYWQHYYLSAKLVLYDETSWVDWRNRIAERGAGASGCQTENGSADQAVYGISEGGTL